MLRFLSKHITANSSEQKAEDLTDFFSYSKVSLHGFPQKISCICLDEKLGLLAIGTKEGTLRIVGAEGVEWTTTIGLNIAHIYFATGGGVLMALCDDIRQGTQSFHRCQIVNDRLVVTRFSQTNLKRITCCEMLNREDGNSALLIGTIIGNIYALWIQNLELVEYLVFLDTVLKGVSGLEGDKKAVNRIEIHPEDAGKLFLMFNNKLVILYDMLQDSVEKVFLPETRITNMCIGGQSKLFCSTISGAYARFSFLVDSSISDDAEINEQSKMLFGPFECTSIAKILCGKMVKTNQEIILFSGGMPAASYGDRYTLTLSSGDKTVVMDFESPVLDFVLLNDSDEENVASALFVLCEQELVVVDLKDSAWPMFALPHFNSIHSSPITSTAVFSHLSESAFSKLRKIRQEQCAKSVFSKRRWPLKCGSTFLQNNKVDELRGKEVTLLLTGHENGSINVWLTNSLSMSPWITLNTASDFEGFIDPNCEPKERHQNSFSSDSDQHSSENAEEQEWPPIRKAGLFDSCSDDHRLSITKIIFEPEIGEIVAAGRAGRDFIILCVEDNLLTFNSQSNITFHYIKL